MSVLGQTTFLFTVNTNNNNNNNNNHILYKYEKQIVLENDNYKLYWDRTLLMDKTILFNQPDITLADKTNKEAAFIDIAIPLTHNLKATITEKQRNHQDLAFEIKQQWQLNKIIVIPLVLSATAVISNMLNQSITTLNVPPHLLSQVQKMVILNTCSIVRKFPSDEVHLSDEEADNPIIMSLYHVPGFIRSFQNSPMQPPSRYLVKSPLCGSLITPGIA
jgi:hypothetical protein